VGQHQPNLEEHMAEKKLSALDVMRKPTGKHADGGSLYLTVSNTGARAWTYRYKFAGKTREMGLGTPPDVSLAEAREKRDAARKLVRDRKDPIQKRDDEHAAKVAAKMTAKKLMTFKQAADGWFSKKRGEWDSPRYGHAVDATLRRYAYPRLADLAVAEITVDDVEAVISPIWKKRHPTAIRLRSTIEEIIGWAIARKARTDLNPASWDIMKELLQKPSTVHVVKHHAHVPVDEMPAFMAELRKRPSLSARLTEFTAVTATRSAEARKACWGEIDWKTGVWTIPAERMKGRKNQRKEHRVPLSSRAVSILRELQGVRTVKPDEYIFPGFVIGKPLSDRTCIKVMELMGRTETLHGFRGSFSSWRRQKMAREFSRELAELALAHKVGTDVERAYQHDDALDARRPLMQAWCDYCLPPGVRLANVA
jgi:integrase